MNKRKEKPEERGPNTGKSKVYRPGTTVEDRENQLISLAINCAEQQLRNGTASSQVITHYLRLGSTKERLEKQMIAQKIELDKAKVENLKSAQRIEELYAKAIDAMKSYGAGITASDEEVIDD